ncbi:MAG: MBL fold metallo-hydrolase [Saprospiraceae bacterium]|nr:MBL fold metallo-hydrolase [Saprospiraceae bacterium]HMW38437.1 MBL fold metallo-hydrolase [Saprospiraceae bacterium]HMX87593.1 MBL fold metallo-hydrolase [Saprospiraceae bacterium]HMZ40900.1 MBL fold metallo-hydrolase [Saprospiraceae bacterium]HNA65035.1 MBL fold metallo-hydrolase [Saprospiraceae bacterium]
MQIKCFTVNPFYENTYLIWDKHGVAAVIDPGFYSKAEWNSFASFISDHQLILSDVILTHAHLDHIFGCEEIYRNFGLRPRMHADEISLYHGANQVAAMYGLDHFEYPPAGDLLSNNEVLHVGQLQLKILYTPGHSPGGISLYSEAAGLVFSGDALFEGSIGRTDLPGGNMEILRSSIRNQLFTLPSETTVYSGHGGVTAIGQEILTNPFF